MKSEVRLIDVNAATLSTYNNPYWTESEAAGVRSFLLHQPTIDPETLRPTGRWENYPSHVNRRCSVCKIEYEKPKFNVRAKYCPNCGAKMEG